MKMELIEDSETSAISIVTAGNYPKENILHGKRTLPRRSLLLIYHIMLWVQGRVNIILLNLSRKVHISLNGFSQLTSTQ